MCDRFFADNLIRALHARFGAFVDEPPKTRHWKHGYGLAGDP